MYIADRPESQKLKFWSSGGSHEREAEAIRSEAILARQRRPCRPRRGSDAVCARCDALGGNGRSCREGLARVWRAFQVRDVRAHGKHWDVADSNERPGLSP